MALTPIARAVPLAAVSDGVSSPGRPAGPQERLVVPGRPQVELLRPPDSPGRIPVAAVPPLAADEADLIEQIEQQVKSSREYQTIKHLLPERVRDSDDAHEHEHERAGRRPRREAETQPVEVSPRGESASLEVQVEGRVRISLSLRREPASVQKSDPLVLDLDGDGLETTGVEQGVAFDINADGRADQTSFVTGGDAFLALDRNGNGSIDDGAELFGDQNGHSNGFAALSDYDDNADGLIDSADSVFTQLRLFSLDADGTQQLRSLQSQGVQAIQLNHRNTDQALNAYDTVAQSGSFVREDGSEGVAGDLLLGYRQLKAVV